ncbi:MAG: hypothetical protein LBG88_00505 [Christensenellaceae bacterium]|jgi:hypothetical protein|nr:hypothetical protein [Christensenellaceae bacterium]
MRKKEKMLMMFTDGRKKMSGWVSLAGVLFHLAWVVAIVSSFILLCAVVLYPIVWIMLIFVTLGLILINGAKSPNVTPFMDGFMPFVITVWYVTLGLFVLKWVLEWLVVLKQSHELNKDKVANADRIAIAGAVRKAKIINLVVFAVITVAVIILSAVMPTVDSAFAQKALPLMLGAVVLGTYIGGKIAVRKTFIKVHPNMNAIERGK